MIKSQILFKESIDLQNVVIKSSPNSRKTTPEIEKIIEEKWIEAQKDAKIKGKKTWNAKNYRLDKYEFNSSTLKLYLNSVEYKEQIVFRTIDNSLLPNEDFYTKGMFTISIIKTTDNNYVFGKTGTAYHNNPISYIGGAYGLEDIKLIKGSDLLKGLLKELNEEININAENISKSKLLGMYLTPYYNVAVLFNIELNLNSQEVQELFNKENDGDIAKLLFIEESNLKEFILNSGENHKIISEFI